MSLEDDIRAIHADVTFTVHFSLTPRGRIRWEASMKGTDFLDGDWENPKSGSATDHKTAMKDAVAAYEGGS